MSKKQHARYSPSTLSSLQKCLRFKFDETEDMKAAGDEGTLLHYACETGDLRGLDEKQRMDVQMSRDYVNSLRAGLSAGWLELSEGRLVLKDLTFGHVDLLLIDVVGKNVHVVDYKFTRVDSDPGEQLRAYGAAAVEMLLTDGLRLKSEDLVRLDAVNKVVTHIVAPRLGGPPVVDEYDANDLLARVRRDIAELYARIDDPWAPENPEYPELCARCARAGRCPSVNKVVARMAPELGVTIPTIFDLSMPVTPEERAIRQNIRGLLDKWCEQVGKDNNEFAIAGGTVPGYKLQTRSNGFKVPRESTKTALDLLSGKLSLPLDVVAGSLTLSVAELSKQLAQVTTDPEATWKGRLMEALEGVGTNTSSTFLVKESKKAKKEIGG